MSFIGKFIGKYIMPSRGAHISDTWDLDTNWKKCQQFYGPGFNFQLININKKVDKVWLPPVKLFRTQLHDYMHDRNNGRYNMFKTQWLLNDYLTTGWRYPVQAVWNWRLRLWEIHPGFQRGLIYNLFNVQEWQAWYQPMTDKTVDCVYKSTDPHELLRTLGYDDYQFIDAELISYFNKPMLKFCIHLANLKSKADTYHDLFYDNIKNGLNITGPRYVIDAIKQEVATWPEHKLKKLIVFENPDSRPTLHFKTYDKDMFYVGLYLAGTTLTSWEDLGIRYEHH